MLVKIPKKSKTIQQTTKKKDQEEEEEEKENDELDYNEKEDDKDYRDHDDTEEDDIVNDEEEELAGDELGGGGEEGTEDSEGELTAEEIESIIEDESIPPENKEIEVDKPDLESSIIISSPIEESQREEKLESINDDLENVSSSIEENGDELEELDEERKLANRLENLSFLKEYAKATYRQANEVCDKLAISPKSGKQYINEYIQVVKDSISNKTYPDSVLIHYNKGIEDENKYLRFHEVDKLRDVVKKYSRYDVAAQLMKDKTLNSNSDDTFISNKRVALTTQQRNNNNDLSLLRQATEFHNNNNNLSSLNGGGGSSQGGRNSNYADQGLDIDELHDGITALQLIRFGLTNTFGQAAKMKISKMIGNNPNPYLVDEQKMKNLLLMAGATESRSEYFIDWLKTNAPHVSHPVGFLSYGNTGSGNPMMGGNGMGYSQPGYNGGGHSSNELDEMTQYYYHIGVYEKGLPPNHPINREALKNYREQKREDEQMKSIDKKLNMGIRMKVLDSFSSMGQGGNGNGGNSLFSPEMLLLSGMAKYERTGTDDNGKPIWSIVPNIGGGGNSMFSNGQGGGQGNGSSSTDQLTSMMMMMKEMMSFMQTVNKPDPTQQSFLQTIMQGIATKMFAPPTNQVEDLAKSMEILNRLKGPEIPVAAAQGAITDPNVIVETERMRTDKEFGMRILDLKEKELDLKRNRLEHGDREANQNLDKLIEGFSNVVPTLLEFGKNIFLGNRNGQPGGGGVMPGMMSSPDGSSGQPPAGANFADTYLRMEYEKQLQAKKLEAEEKRRQWEEEVRKRESEYNYYQPNDPYAVQQPPPHTPPETQTVIVQEPTNRPKPKTHDDEFFTEETFLPHSPQEIEDAIRKADKQIKLLEHYKATAGTVLQDKIASGEGYNNNSDNERQTEDMNDGYNTPIENHDDDRQGEYTGEPMEQDGGIEEEEQDFSKILDEYPSGVHDPDYVGPKSEIVEEVDLKEETENKFGDQERKEEIEEVEL